MRDCEECPKCYEDEFGNLCCKESCSDIPKGLERYAIKLDDGDVKCYSFDLHGFKLAQNDIDKYNPKDKTIYHIEN